MSDLVSICSFRFSSEAHVAQEIFENEGIRTYLKDELTSQLGIYYSAPVGGIKLQVSSDDLEKALEICREQGYVTDFDPVEDKNNLFAFVPDFINWFNAKTSGIPLLNRLQLFGRLVIFLILISIILAVIINLF
jgi:hypothetical protein